MMYRWNADKALELIERERVTHFIGVPTQSWDLVNSPRFADFDTSSLRSVGGGGAPAPPALVERVAGSVRTGSPNLGYGMTETNAFGPGQQRHRLPDPSHVDRPGDADHASRGA